ncbi:MAG: hypothetical protein ACYTG2_19340 [Planctomycetota bacterium]|jgi:hypothetical protein
MAKCKWCDQGGFLKKVDKEGLCAKCGPTVLAEIERQSGVIYEAMHVYERATEPDERLANCDRVIEAAQALLPYEDKGLTTCSPPARLLVEEYREFRKQCGQG